MLCVYLDSWIYILKQHASKGTGITLYGFSNASYEAFLDKHKQPSNSKEDILFQSSGTKFKKHEIRLKVDSVNESQIFTFDKAIVTSEAIGKSVIIVLSLSDEANQAY